jgi:predicted porin
MFLGGIVIASSALAAAQVSVTVSHPTSGFSGPSPMQFVISAYSSAAAMSSMAISVDGTEIFFQWGDSFTAYLWLAKGKHTVVVTGTDVDNNTGSETLSVTSTNGMGTVSNINNWGVWEVCTTNNCVGGDGKAISNTYPFQTSPSLDGSSREFTLGGVGPYSNAYWYAFIGGSDSATNFVYDTWVLLNNPGNPQALELDVNQSFDQQRWVFGTQCNYKGAAPLGGYWNVWNGATSQWVATKVACKPFAANTWHHIIWAVIRTGNLVHYVSVEIDGVSHSVNLQLGEQPHWTGADIDVSVQLDGDYNQDPYDLWIDEMKLTAF